LRSNSYCFSKFICSFPSSKMRFPMRSTESMISSYFGADGFTALWANWQDFNKLSV
jgi:hypothetical protein